MGKSKVENIVDLQDQLLNMFERYLKGDVGNAEMKAVSILCGKIMSASKLEMEHNKLTQSGAKVKFLIARDEQKG